MRIGIFGGCFNPPHNMHKNIALNLVNNGYLDKVIYVPTGNYYNKPNLVKDIDRYEMLKLMTQDYSFLEVSDYEFGKLTYTYQTLLHFQKLYKEDTIYFICGTDNLSEFQTWKEYEFILENFKLLVIKRNGDNIDDFKVKYAKNLENVEFAYICFKNMSSTYIRNKISSKDYDLLNDMDRRVLSYIKRKRLYG